MQAEYGHEDEEPFEDLYDYDINVNEYKVNEEEKIDLQEADDDMSFEDDYDELQMSVDPDEFYYEEA